MSKFHGFEKKKIYKHKLASNNHIFHQEHPPIATKNTKFITLIEKTSSFLSEKRFQASR